MANNFRLTGGSYYSKDGSDANSGATPDLPKVTIATASSPQIIGSGEYKQTFVLSSNSSPHKFNADGFVKLLHTANSSGTGTLGGQQLEFNDQTQSPNFFWWDLNTFTYTFLHLNGGITFNQTWFTNGDLLLDTVSGTQFFKGRNGVVFESINFNRSGGNTNIFDLNKCLLFNTNVTGTVDDIYDSCYADSSTVITQASYFTTPATQFVNNCFNGQFSIGGVLYELKQDKDGNAVDPNPAINDLALIDATVYTRGNFYQDAEFSNLSKRDYYTVANTSPLLFAASDATNIGDTRAGTLVKVVDDIASTVDLTLSSGDYIYDTGSGSGFGTATFGAKQIAPVPQVIGRVDIAQLLNFNSLEAIGSAENTNVTIVDNFTTGTAGANPRRLTYEMRWSTQTSTPTQDSDYDNGGIVTAGNYSKFEHFTQPKVDVTSLGNGDSSYNPSGAVFVQAKWVQIRITVREGIG